MIWKSKGGWKRCYYDVQLKGGWIREGIMVEMKGWMEKVAL